MAGMSEQVAAVGSMLSDAGAETAPSTSTPEKGKRRTATEAMEAPERGDLDGQGAAAAKLIGEGSLDGGEGEIDGAADGHREPKEDDDDGDGEPPAKPTKRPEDIHTLNDFAEATGWDIADIYALKVKLTGDGEELSIGEFKDRIQRADQSAAQVKAQRQALEQERAQFKAAAERIMAQRQEVSSDFIEASARVKAIQDRFNGINWEALAEQDPGRAAYMQQQFAADYAGATADVQRAQQADQAQRQAYQQQIQHQQQEHMQAHQQAFLEAVPEWRVPEVAQREGEALGKYLGQWFKPQEMQSIYDWRGRMLARKAMLWDLHQYKAGRLDKQVRAAPKQVMRPGSGSTANSAGNLKALMHKASTTRSRNDQVAAINALFNSRGT